MFIVIILVLMCIFVIIKEFPKKPSITYGEFPFYIEVKINGETTKISDTVICEYLGINGGSNVMYREWRKKLKERKSCDLILVAEENKKIYCSVGDANYYMGDSKSEEHIPVIYVTEYDSISKMYSQKLYVPENEKNKIELIAWEFSKPIINSFETGGGNIRGRHNKLRMQNEKCGIFN